MRDRLVLVDVAVCVFDSSSEDFYVLRVFTVTRVDQLFSDPDVCEESGDYPQLEFAEPVQVQTS